MLQGSAWSATVDYAPGGRSVSHRHAGSAFVYAFVLSGAVRSEPDSRTDVGLSGRRERKN
jgi:quercetin dioxygenase-like cupin family protein